MEAIQYKYNPWIPIILITCLIGMPVFWISSYINNISFRNLNDKFFWELWIISIIISIIPSILVYFWICILAWKLMKGYMKYPIALEILPYEKIIDYNHGNKRIIELKDIKVVEHKEIRGSKTNKEYLEIKKHNWKKISIYLSDILWSGSEIYNQVLKYHNEFLEKESIVNATK